MWLSALKAVTANFVVVIAIFGYGTWISRLLPESFPRFTRSACAFIGGFGILGLILFVVGYLSFTRWTIGLILAIGVILAGAGKLRPWGIRRTIAIAPAVVVGFVLALTALIGLEEPVGDWTFDGVSYHLVGSKVWLRSGIVRPIPDNMCTSYPSTAEMVFASLYAFGGDRAPGLSAAWTLALLLAIAGALGQRCGLDANGVWWVAALIATMPAVFQGSNVGFIDAIYAAFVLAAVRIGLDANKKKHFVAFGIFCGFAMATKYPGIVALPALVLCAAWRRSKGEYFKTTLLNVSLAVVSACMVASPMYLKNWYFLGSPLYPPPAWVTHFVHVKYMPPEALSGVYDFINRRARGHGGGILHFLSLPFNLTYHSADFSGAGGIGLTPLALAPFGVLTAWREPFARRLTLVSFLLLVLWFLTAQEARYLIHFYCLSTVFAVLGWQFVDSRTGKVGKLLCTMAVTISLGYGLIMMSKDQEPGLSALFSPALAKQRRETYIPFVEGIDYLNHDPSVTRVLILDRLVLEYYLDKDYIKPFGQWGEQVFPDADKPSEILRRLNELHVSHILDVRSPITDFCVPRDYPGLSLVFERPGQRIFRVTP